jgi:hypothetical protein
MYVTTQFLAASYAKFGGFRWWKTGSMGRATRWRDEVVSDNAFRHALIAREGSRPRSEQSDLYRFMTDPELAELRAWVDSALAAVGTATAVKLRAVLHTQQFRTAMCELAVGEQLARSGFDVLYEPKLDDRTPDFYIKPTTTHRGLIVEVWNRQPRNGTANRRRRWHALLQRVHSIPVPVVMALPRCPAHPRSGYLFRNGSGEEVRIMNRNGGWDVRIKNAGGQYLDEFGNAPQGKGAKSAAHGISVSCI